MGHEDLTGRVEGQVRRLDDQDFPGRFAEGGAEAGEFVGMGEVGRVEPGDLFVPDGAVKDETAVGRKLREAFVEALALLNEGLEAGSVGEVGTLGGLRALSGLGTSGGLGALSRLAAVYIVFQFRNIKVKDIQ